MARIRTRIQGAVLSLALACAAGPAAAQERVALPYDGAYPPLSFTTESGAADGFDVAVARALAETMGLAADFVAADFFEIQAGDWPEDWVYAAASMSATDQRARHFDFVGPYYYDFVVLIGPESAGDALPQPAPGDRIGVCAGCVYRDFLEGNYLTGDGTPGVPRFPGTEIVDFATDTDLLRNLVDGDGPDAIDFGVTSARFAEHFRTLGFGIAVSRDTVFVTPAFVAVPRSGGIGTEAVQAAFERLSEEGRIAALSVAHLGRDYTDPVVFADAPGTGEGR